MKKAGISTTKENKVEESFVYHFQLLQTEQLICTLKNEKVSLITRTIPVSVKFVSA